MTTVVLFAISYSLGLFVGLAVGIKAGSSVRNNTTKVGITKCPKL